MVDFGKFDKIRKINRKVDKPNTDNGFRNYILTLFQKDLYNSYYHNYTEIIVISKHTAVCKLFILDRNTQ